MMNTSARTWPRFPDGVLAGSKERTEEMRPWWEVDPSSREWNGRGWYYMRRIEQRPPRPPVDEERIRKIVREEIADLPIRFDVPDAPPEVS